MLLKLGTSYIILYMGLNVNCSNDMTFLVFILYFNAGAVRNFEVVSCGYNGPGSSSRYSDSLRGGKSGDRVPVGERFSAPVQTGPGALPSLLYNGYRVFPGSKAVGA